MPSSLPTNSRPLKAVGWPYVAATPGNPNAHFSLRLPTWARVIPAATVDWKRRLRRSAPQPAHTGGLGGGSRSRAQKPLLLATCWGEVDRYSAIALFCGSERCFASHFILPERRAA